MLEDSPPASPPPSDSPSACRPTRGADRGPVDRTDPASESVRLPALDDGVTLLDVDDGSEVPVVQALALDHLLLHDGPVLWVDADGHATTTALARIAPGRRLLDRIHVARGFTAYQHYGAIRDLPAATHRRGRRTTDGPDASRRESPGRGDAVAPPAPSLVVAPAIDAPYRTDDTLGPAGAETLQARALARLVACADGHDVPVLVTRRATDAFSSPVATAADARVQCEATRTGPRFVGDGFETSVYPAADGASYQTTFAYWRQVLATRAARVGSAPTAPPSPTAGTADVGPGVTVDGDPATRAANPLLDARTGAGAADGTGRR